MKLITTNDQLRSYVPNILIEVQGEVPLFDKLRHHLRVQEDVFNRDICDIDVLLAYNIESLTEYARTYVALRTLYFGLSELDVVLTPNGFGVVSNQTIAPASKERVASLSKSIAVFINQSWRTLYYNLTRLTDWATEQPQGQLNACTVYGPSIVFDLHQQEDVEAWPRLLPVLRDIEAEISEKAVSPALMTNLRLQTYPDTMPTLNRGHFMNQLNLMVRRLTRRLVEGEPLNVTTELGNIVQYLRTNSEAFVDWSQSEQAKLWEPVVFENKKDNRAYWM